ncbi:hypothetical protein LV164_005532 [Aspergillus fumigatus]|nr:hypothetical protein KXX42_007372 [Aspergillus fumigatus]KAH1976716.1 hypothetical protein KXW88_008909 [Aspergillus fumigatus]KAH2757525.1 hypothetical protein KXV94_008741 [Aspergillus fumigatus]KAH3140507.1 hypothetical protein KXW18_003036 [Aspergillus fumigatus]KAH3187013.1 hypothetical protein KXV92_005556 [Aspergillus fumigatus]
MDPSALDLLICSTCGVQYDTTSGLKSCKICDDPRQYVPPSGQSWTTLRSLQASPVKYRNVFTTDPENPNLISIQTAPKFAIGQRAFLCLDGSGFGNILWDCITYLDDETIRHINSLGGIRAIVISHPHYFSTSIQWADAFNCDLYISAEDEEWVANRGDGHRLKLWKGKRLFLPSQALDSAQSSDFVAIKTGGHFPGSSVLWWKSAKKLLIADTIMIVPSGLYRVDRPPWYCLLFVHVVLSQLSIEDIDFEDTHGAFTGQDARGNIFDRFHFIQFHGSLVKDGKHGGLEAARLLIQAVQDYIHKVDPEAPPNISCKIRVFANIEGLTEAYRNNNILSVEESLTSFIQGFNQENALCDFVDAGNGKECADVKLRACFEQDIIDVHCRRIIFCASADNSHARVLSPHRGSKRISLVKGPPFAQEMGELAAGFTTDSFENVFMANKLKTTRRVSFGAPNTTATPPRTPTPNYAAAAKATPPTQTSSVVVSAPANGMLTLCNTLSLDVNVPVTDDSDMIEHYHVGNELGLTGRFNKYVCDPVAKVLSVTEHAHLTFGDFQAAVHTQCSDVPDVVVLSVPRLDVIAVGELKPILDGQLISYMRNNRLKYGFLSTYRSTVFVRRTGDFRFELSLPIDEQATNPSLRQCFVAVCLLASQDGIYTEAPDFNPARLKIPFEPFVQLSIRPSPFRNEVATKTHTPREAMGSESILFGGRDGVAQEWVNCHRLIKGSHIKALYEVTWNGQAAIAKCWSNARHKGYVHEVSTYERLSQLRPAGFEFFAPLQTHEKIVCSSIFPKGHIMIIKKVQGEPLDRQWDLLSSDHRDYIRTTIYKAVEVLRRIGYISVDSGKHNVLYSPGTRTVTMVDFELMQKCDQSTMSAELPEMHAIFGKPFISGSQHHLGG